MLCFIEKYIVSACQPMITMWGGFSFVLMLFNKSISSESRHPAVLLWAHLLKHHIHFIQTNADSKNYQIVALTTLWSFLAHEVTQNLIFKYLNAEKSDKYDSQIKCMTVTDIQYFWDIQLFAFLLRSCDLGCAYFSQEHAVSLKLVCLNPTDNQSRLCKNK